MRRTYKITGIKKSGREDYIFRDAKNENDVRKIASRYFETITSVTPLVKEIK